MGTTDHFAAAERLLAQAEAEPAEVISRRHREAAHVHALLAVAQAVTCGSCPISGLPGDPGDFGLRPVRDPEGRL